MGYTASMRRIRQRVSALVVAATCVAACQPTTAVKPVGRASAAPHGTSVAATPAATSARAASPATLQASPTGSVPSARPLLPATLTGTVLAPAKFISDAGSGFISDAGSGLISDAGSHAVVKSGYRLTAATEEQPVVGAHVALLDAAGQPVKGPDGQPLTADTDAAGAYRFSAALPGGNLIAAVTLAHGHGSLQAIVVPPLPSAVSPPPGTAGNSARQANIDLVSTLTTGYILDRYVKTQADPVKTLDKLPADVEADTRAKAQAALASGSVAVPDTLATTQVVATVESLRKANKALDDQLELVKKLLIAAGQSNQGSGLPGTQVYLGRVSGLVAGPGGSMYVSTNEHLWLLDASGNATIQTAYDGIPVGSGFATTSGAGGQQLLTLFGSDGVPVAFDLGGTDTSTWLAGCARPDGGGYLLQQPLDLIPLQMDATPPPPNDPVVLWQLSTSAPPVKLYTFPAADGTRLAHVESMAVEPGGTIAMIASVDGGPPDAPDSYYTTSLLRFDPATHALTTLESGPIAGSKQPLLDRQGHLFTLDATSRTLSTLDGQVVLSGDPLPALNNAAAAGLSAALVSPTLAYVGVGNHVYRVEGGHATLVAGSDGDPTSATTQLPLKTVQGLAVAKDGTMILSEVGGDFGRLVSLAPGQAPVTIAGAAHGASTFQDGVNAQAFNISPAVVHLDPNGSVCFLADGPLGGEIYRIDTNKALRQLYAFDPAGHVNTAGGEYVRDFAFGHDGTLYVLSMLGTIDAAGFTSNARARVVAVSPTGTRTTVWDGPTDPEVNFATAPMAIGLDRAGGLYFAGPDPTFKFYYAETDPGDPPSVVPGALLKLHAGASPQVLATSPDLDQPTGLVCDASGRIVVTTASKVLAYQGTLAAIAGPGTKLFAGAGIDDGLQGVLAPAIAPNGDLLFVDGGHHQVKRIPVASF